MGSNISQWKNAYQSWHPFSCPIGEHIYYPKPIHPFLYIPHLEVVHMPYNPPSPIFKKNAAWFTILEIGVTDVAFCSLSVLPSTMFWVLNVPSKQIRCVRENIHKSPARWVGRWVEEKWECLDFLPLHLSSLISKWSKSSWLKSTLDVARHRLFALRKWQHLQTSQKEKDIGEMKQWNESLSIY